MPGLNVCFISSNKKETALWIGTVSRFLLLWNYFGLFDDEILSLDDSFAVVAFEESFHLVDSDEFGEHRLVVGDALRVDAFDGAFDFRRKFQRLFLYDLIIFDDVDLGVRGEEGHFVHLVLFQEFVGHFDDGLFVQSVAFQVDAECHLAVALVELQYGDDVEQFFGRNMVDDSTVF